MTGSRARPWCQPTAPLYATGSGADAGAALAALVTAAAPSPTPTASTAAASTTATFLFRALPPPLPGTQLRRPATSPAPTPVSPGPGPPVGPREPQRHAQQGQADAEDGERRCDGLGQVPARGLRHHEQDIQGTQGKHPD